MDQRVRAQLATRTILSSSYRISDEAELMPPHARAYTVPDGTNKSGKCAAERIAGLIMNVRKWRSFLGALGCLAVADIAAHVPAWSQQRGPADLSIELVDPNVLRVCADPHNLPFSNEQNAGFENKLAAMFAAKLGKRLGYAWFPQA